MLQPWSITEPAEQTAPVAVLAGVVAGLQQQDFGITAGTRASQMLQIFVAPQAQVR